MSAHERLPLRLALMSSNAGDAVWTWCLYWVKRGPEGDPLDCRIEEFHTPLYQTPETARPRRGLWRASATETTDTN
jgi:hypothetical protein